MLLPSGWSPGLTRVVVLCKVDVSMISISLWFVVFSHKNKGISHITCICIAVLHVAYSPNTLIINPANVYPNITPSVLVACKAASHLVEFSDGANSFTQTGP